MEFLGAKSELPFQLVYKPLGENISNHPVPAVLPSWIRQYSLGNGETKLKLSEEGEVTVKYKFGGIQDSQYKRYYRTNTRCSGLEIRQNGRLIDFNIFTEIWGKEPHNMYNHVLVIVDLESEYPNRLPCTRTSKNGYRQGDSRLAKVYDFVRTHMPELPKEIGNAQDETDLFEQLKTLKNHVPDPKTVEREMKFFTTLGETKIRADLYVAHNGEITIYEGKKDITTVKDVYQLRMYWDGAVKDGLTPTLGYLISAQHPNSVDEIIQYMNTLQDAAGNFYTLKTRTWKDEDIPYPQKGVLAP